LILQGIPFLFGKVKTDPLGLLAHIFLNELVEVLYPFNPHRKGYLDFNYHFFGYLGRILAILLNKFFQDTLCRRGLKFLAEIPIIVHIIEIKTPRKKGVDIDIVESNQIFDGAAQADFGGEGVVALEMVCDLIW